MLWLAKPLKNRFTVRINDEGQRFGIFMNNEWDFPTIDSHYGSLTGAVCMFNRGTVINLRSQEGFAQRMVFVDIERAKVVGSIKITGKGGLILTDGKNENLNAEWPILLRTQTIAIIGIPKKATFRLFDLMTADESFDMWYDANKKERWWFPHHLRNARKNHDEKDRPKVNEARSVQPNEMKSKTEAKSATNAKGAPSECSMDSKRETKKESKPSTSGTSDQLERMWLRPGDVMPYGAHYTSTGRCYIHVSGHCAQCMGDDIKERDETSDESD